MDVLFENNTNEEINYKLIEKVISEALRYEGVNDNTEVSVTIVDNEEIRKLIISLEILIEQQMYYHFR